jgi:hypothetical protein
MGPDSKFEFGCLILPKLGKVAIDVALCCFHVQICLCPTSLFKNKSHDIDTAVECIQPLSWNPAGEVISCKTNLGKGSSTPLGGELRLCHSSTPLGGEL